MRDLITLIENAQLAEAPLADFQFVGDPEEPGSMEDNDLKAIGNPKWRMKLVKTFRNTDANINIYLINYRDGEFKNQTGSLPATRTYGVLNSNLYDLDKISGRYSPEDFERNFGFLPPKFETSINVVLTNNFGDEKLPLTPWIVAHRIIHALASKNHYWTRNSDTNLVFDKYWIKIQSAMVVMREFYHDHDPVLSGYGAHDKEIFRKTSSLKSAQNGSIARAGEFYIELATQMFLTGDFKFDYSEFELTDSQVEDIEYNLRKAKQYLHDTFKSAVGQIFVL